MIPGRLDQLIVTSGVSAAKIARDIGIATGSLSGYRTGAKEPGSKAIVKICKYFKVSSDWLLGTCSDIDNIPSAEEVTGLTRKAIKSIQKMDKNKLSALNVFLESLID